MDGRNRGGVFKKSFEQKSTIVKRKIITRWSLKDFQAKFIPRMTDDIYWLGLRHGGGPVWPVAYKLTWQRTQKQQKKKNGKTNKPIRWEYDRTKKRYRDMYRRVFLNLFKFADPSLAIEQFCGTDGFNLPVWRRQDQTLAAPKELFNNPHHPGWEPLI